MTLAPTLPLATPAGVPFAEGLAGHGDRVALRTRERTLTYRALADQVARRAEQLGTTRRLVLLAGANRVEALVTYLAALSAGHPVLLVPGDHRGHLDAVVEAYDPDVVAGGDGDLRERRAGTAHDLHPDLALLLSTSGSTGSPKLVRLSRENVQANATSIAQYLAIRPEDVAATTLPLHYCYGLSVIHSHLLAGASLLLTDLSVVDRCFWEDFRAAGATTLAGVPYTFDLLDRVGFAEMELPTLRYVTQAGGRLAPHRVRAYAELGRRRGWELFVMYGQTEATARMAYLPPEQALTSPGSIGVPVPGGSFALEPLPEVPFGRAGELDVGELVYTGPNVMMGYAETPADLARGRTVSALRTGDVARRTPDGLFEIVGRRNRFAKIFGLRVDLDEVERIYAGEGLLVACAAAEGQAVAGQTGEQLVVAISDDAAAVDPGEVAALARRHLGLPPTAVAVRPVREVPRLPSGKPDYRAVAALGPQDQTPRQQTEGTASARLRRVYAEVLHRDEVSEADSFVSLEGDSLSYVEASIRVEEVLGRLPAGWHTMPVAALARGHDDSQRTDGRSPDRPDRPARRWRSIEGNVLLRAFAIVAIVGSHANLFVLVGGAHLLLGLAGFNVGRFHLTDSPGADRRRHLAVSIARIALPSMLVIGVVATWTSGLDWRNALLLNAVLGPPDWAEPAWHYWFIEALVYLLLGLLALLALPGLDRVERRWPFWLPMGLVGLGLLTRYEVVVLAGGDVIHRAHVVAWLFALGWATAKASHTGHRVLVSAVLVATVPGFFDDPAREALVVAGLLVLVWLRAVRVPAVLARLAGVLAGASLYVYLIHWQVYPHLEHELPWLATVLSLLAGIALWQVAERVTARLRLRSSPPSAPDGSTRRESDGSTRRE